MSNYFYIDNQGKQKGTFTVDELKQENIRKETLVWTQGMEQWKPACEVPELSRLFTYQSTPTADYLFEANRNYSSITDANQKPIKPKTWLTESILVTVISFLFCCNVFGLLGIIAIVKATQVDSDYAGGDYAAALQSSKDARKWTLIVFWISIVLVLLYIAFLVVMFYSIGSISGIRELYEI